MKGTVETLRREVELERKRSTSNVKLLAENKELKEQARELKARLAKIAAVRETRTEDTSDWPDRIAHVLSEQPEIDAWPTIDLLEAIGFQGDPKTDRNALMAIKAIMTSLGWKKKLVPPLDGKGCRVNGYRKPGY